MRQWNDIRYKVKREGVSKRHIMRETGMHWKTLEKILANSAPSGHRRNKGYTRELDSHVDWIKAILESDKSQHKKHRVEEHSPVWLPVFLTRQLLSTYKIQDY